MKAYDPNLNAVELVAEALGDLCQERVGGCSVGLLITDEARPPVRQTVDVDLVAEVASIGDYYSNLHSRLRERGFVESPDAENICRWKRGNLVVDVMPSTGVLGHSTNVWYADVLSQAQSLTLPSRRQILVVAAPVFLATKLASFEGRGGGDYLHHDMEDIINVVDGREELVREVKANVNDALRQYIEEEIDALLADEAFVDQLSWHFAAANQTRIPIVIQRLRALAGI